MWGQVKKSISHSTGFSLVESQCCPAQLFLVCKGKWTALDFIFICHPSYVMATLEGHSVSLPRGLLSLEEHLKNQQLTRSIQDVLVNDFHPQRDEA